MLRKLLLSGAALLLSIVAAPSQTNLGPVTWALTASGTAAMAAVPANPSRRGFTICNNHASQTVNFTTGTVTPVSGSVGQFLAANNVATSCYTTPALTAGVGVGAQINIIASGATTPVTVLEY